MKEKKKLLNLLKNHFINIEHNINASHNFFFVLGFNLFFEHNIRVSIINAILKLFHILS